jgi:hypothetical protein
VVVPDRTVGLMIRARSMTVACWRIGRQRSACVCHHPRDRRGPAGLAGVIGGGASISPGEDTRYLMASSWW